jgi:hypothetical protein
MLKKKEKKINFSSVFSRAHYYSLHCDLQNLKWTPAKFEMDTCKI